MSIYKMYFHRSLNLIMYGTPKRHLIIGDDLLQPVIKFVIGGGPMRSVINFSIGDKTRSVVNFSDRSCIFMIGDGI